MNIATLQISIKFITSFRFFWGFTHPKDPFWLVVSPTPAFFLVLLGFYPPQGPLLVGRFPNTPPSFRFFWGFTHPKEPLLVGRFPNPPPSFRFFWGFTHPKDHFWLVVSTTPRLLSSSSGVLPAPRTSYGWPC